MREYTVLRILISFKAYRHTHELRDIRLSEYEVGRDLSNTPGCLVAITRDDGSGGAIIRSRRPVISTGIREPLILNPEPLLPSGLL